MVESKEKAKSRKIAPRKNQALEILHQRLGHRSTICLMAGDIAIFWQDIEIRIYPEPFSHHARYIQ